MLCFLEKPVLRKSVNNLNPQFLWNCFNFSTLPYELRKGNEVNLPEKWNCHYGINSILFSGALPWNNSPVILKKVILWSNLKKRLRN